MIKIGTALFEAAEQFEREKGISKEVLISSLCDALVAAYKKHLRIKEIEKLGYKKCIIPESNKKLLKDNHKLDIIGVRNVLDALNYFKLK